MNNVERESRDEETDAALREIAVCREVARQLEELRRYLEWSELSE